MRKGRCSTLGQLIIEAWRELAEIIAHVWLCRKRTRVLLLWGFLRSDIGAVPTVYSKRTAVLMQVQQGEGHLFSGTRTNCVRCVSGLRNYPLYRILHGTLWRWRIQLSYEVWHRRERFLACKDHKELSTKGPLTGGYYCAAQAIWVSLSPFSDQGAQQCQQSRPALKNRVLCYIWASLRVVDKNNQIQEARIGQPFCFLSMSLDCCKALNSVCSKQLLVLSTLL